MKKEGRRNGEKVELTESGLLLQKSTSNCFTERTTTASYKMLDVASKKSSETAPRAARVERSDCSKMRRRTSQGKDFWKGTRICREEKENESQRTV